MTRNPLLYLNDIVESIARIQQYTANLTFDTFAANNMVIDAVVRNLEIIGEAAAHISENIQSLYPEVAWYEMKGMRNIVAHEYFRVDLEIVWKTAHESLPSLGLLIKRILEEQQ